MEEDCRISASKIAKQTNLSPEGVIKVIKRLQNNKILAKFKTKISYSRMGYTLLPVNIKLKKVNKDIIKRIKATIKQHKSFTWYKFCEGEYDLMLSFKIGSAADRSDMNNLISKLSDLIAEKEVSVVLSAFEICKSFLDQKHKNKIFKTLDHTEKPIDLSQEDHKLINLLRKNSRESVLTLANKLNSTARKVMVQLKRLEKAGVISGFKSKINMTILNYQPCIALMTLGECTDNDFKKFISYCRYAPGIHYFLHQIGRYDVELTIDSKSLEDLYNLVDDMRNKFPFINKITTLIAKEVF